MQLHFYRGLSNYSIPTAKSVKCTHSATQNFTSAGQSEGLGTGPRKGRSRGPAAVGHFEAKGFRVLGFRVSGFGVLGFRARVLGLWERRSCGPWNLNFVV